MSPVLIVGGGLFGSIAAAWVRRNGMEAIVFDCAHDGAASHAAAGLFKEEWAGKKLKQHFTRALPVLDKLFGLRAMELEHDDGRKESFHFVPPSAILDGNPIRKRVSVVGDGWLEAGNERFEGFIYVAAGVWTRRLIPDVDVFGKAGAAFTFPGERPGRVRQIAYGRQAFAFVRDQGATYFSDGTAEEEYAPHHEQETLARAAAMGLTDAPASRLWGIRPYVRGGPLYRRIGRRTWVASGGRKMGTILGASLARVFVDEMLGSGH